MNRIAVLMLLGVVSVLSGFAQGSQTDSQTLQAILAEMRSMHNDVRLSQTTQILLSELQLQQTAVNRVMQKRDDLRTRVSQMQTSQKSLASQIDQAQEKTENSTNPAEKKQLLEMQENLKNMVANQKSQEMEWGNNLREAEASLRAEQDKLDGIQTQLDDVVRRLQPANSR